MRKCSCGCEEVTEIINPEGSLHYGAIRCSSCNTFLGNMRKPENADMVRRKNDKWKQRHIEKHGKLECVWCGVTEDYFIHRFGWQFQVDHIKPISENGPDSFENTQILCFVCHGDKTNRRKQLSELKKLINL